MGDDKQVGKGTVKKAPKPMREISIEGCELLGRGGNGTHSPSR